MAQPGLIGTSWQGNTGRTKIVGREVLSSRKAVRHTQSTKSNQKGSNRKEKLCEQE